MLHVLAQLCPFTRFPFMSGKVPKTSVSPETSSPNREVGGRVLRRLMLKMSVSPETSSENGDIEIAGLIFGTSKTAVSPETSSEKWDVERAVMRHIFGALLDNLQDGPSSEIIEKPMVFNTFDQKYGFRSRHSLKNAFEQVLPGPLPPVCVRAFGRVSEHIKVIWRCR